MMMMISVNFCCPGLARFARKYRSVILVESLFAQNDSRRSYTFSNSTKPSRRRLACKFTADEICERKVRCDVRCTTDAFLSQSSGVETGKACLDAFRKSRHLISYCCSQNIDAAVTSSVWGYDLAAPRLWPKTCPQHMNWTELTWQCRPSYTTCSFVAHVSVTTTLCIDWLSGHLKVAQWRTCVMATK